MTPINLGGDYRIVRSLILLTLWIRQVRAIEKPWSPDQGIEKMGAAGLEPAGLTDVNCYSGNHARNVISLEVELFNN
jgi:hypothetical protein